jgi:hypothetical protein
VSPQVAWSGYAEADPWVVGVLVVAVAALAAADIGGRLWPRRRARRRG